MAEPTNDFTLAYQDTAAGLTMLLIHGFPLNSMMWEPQLVDLSDMVRIIAPDLRGFGYSDMGTESASVAQYAQDCLGLLESIGIYDPVVVCGLSMGGYVALEFFRQFPDRVAALILTATRATADSAEGRRGRDAAIAKVAAEGIDPIVVAMKDKLFAPSTAADFPDLVEDVVAMMAGVSAEGAIGALQAMKTRPDSTPTLPQIDVPTLIIHGESDQIVPLAEAEAMADSIPGSQLVLVPDAGHMPNLEQPAVWNRAAAEFMLLTFGEDDV